MLDLSIDISLFDELEHLGVGSELLGALEHAGYVSPSQYTCVKCATGIGEPEKRAKGKCIGEGQQETSGVTWPPSLTSLALSFPYCVPHTLMYLWRTHHNSNMI